MGSDSFRNTISKHTTRRRFIEKLVVGHSLLLVVLFLACTVLGYVVYDLQQNMQALKSRLKTYEPSRMYNTDPLPITQAQQGWKLGRVSRSAPDDKFCQNVNVCVGGQYEVISLVSNRHREEIKLNGLVQNWVKEYKFGSIYYDKGEVVIQENGYYHINIQMRLAQFQGINGFAVFQVKVNNTVIASAVTNNTEATVVITRVHELKKGDKVSVHVKNGYKWWISKKLMYFQVYKVAPSS